jgi:hypothetical protein
VASGSPELVVHFNKQITAWRTSQQILSRNKKMACGGVLQPLLKTSFLINRLQRFTRKTTTQRVLRKCFLRMRTLVPFHQQPISAGFSIQHMRGFLPLLNGLLDAVNLLKYVQHVPTL